MGDDSVSGSTARTPWLGDDAEHNDACHERWLPRRNRDTGDAAHPDAWYCEQCGGCRFWVALRGPVGADWGACTNSRSRFDGRVRFEHDGCDVFTEREDRSFG